MAQLMLVNPARRRRRPPIARAKARRRRARNSTGQFVATAHTNPTPMARARRRAVVARRATRRVRRNPIGIDGLTSTLTNAAQAAVGGVAVNMIHSMLPLPDTLKSGMGGHITRGALAVALGMLAKPVLGRTAGLMSQGALTLVMFDAIKEAAGTALPGLSGVGWYSPALRGGRIRRPALSAYPGQAAPNDPLRSLYGSQGRGRGMGAYVY